MIYSDAIIRNYIQSCIKLINTFQMIKPDENKCNICSLIKPRFCVYISHNIETKEDLYSLYVSCFNHKFVTNRRLKTINAKQTFNKYSSSRTCVFCCCLHTFPRNLARYALEEDTHFSS